MTGREHYREVGWTFESTITSPSDVRVSVAIEIPESRAWGSTVDRDVLRAAEFAHQSATDAVEAVWTASKNGGVS